MTTRPSSSSTSSSSGKPVEKLTQFEKNHQLIGRSLRLFTSSWQPYAMKLLAQHYGEGQWEQRVESIVSREGDMKPEFTHGNAHRLKEDIAPSNVKLKDTHQLIYLVTRLWDEVFSKEFSLTREVRQWIFEVRTIRNQWAHQEDFNLRETYRALDTIERCLEAIPAEETTREVRKLREYILFKLANKIKERNTREAEEQKKRGGQRLHQQQLLMQQQHPLVQQHLPLSNHEQQWSSPHSPFYQQASPQQQIIYPPLQPQLQQQQQQQPQYQVMQHQFASHQARKADGESQQDNDTMMIDD